MQRQKVLNTAYMLYLYTSFGDTVYVSKGDLFMFFVSDAGAHITALSSWLPDFQGWIARIFLIICICRTALTGREGQLVSGGWSPFETAKGKWRGHFGARAGSSAEPVLQDGGWESDGQGFGPTASRRNAEHGASRLILNATRQRSLSWPLGRLRRYGWLGQFRSQTSHEISKADFSTKLPSTWLGRDLWKVFACWAFL